MLYLDILFVLFVYQDGSMQPGGTQLWKWRGCSQSLNSKLGASFSGNFETNNKKLTKWCQKGGHSVRGCRKLVMIQKRVIGPGWERKKTGGQWVRASWKKGVTVNVTTHHRHRQFLVSAPPPGHAARNRQCTCFCTICKTSDTAKTVNLKLIRTNLDPLFPAPEKSFCNTLNFKFGSIMERGKMTSLADDSLKRPVAIYGTNKTYLGVHISLLLILITSQPQITLSTGKRPMSEIANRTSALGMLGGSKKPSGYVKKENRLLTRTRGPTSCITSMIELRLTMPTKATPPTYERIKERLWWVDWVASLMKLLE